MFKKLLKILIEIIVKGRDEGWWKRHKDEAEGGKIKDPKNWT